MKKYLLLTINVLFSFPLNTLTTENIITHQPLDSTPIPFVATNIINMAVLGCGTKRNECCGSAKVIAATSICIECSSRFASNCICNAMDVPQEDTTTRILTYETVDFILLVAAKCVQQKHFKNKVKVD